MTSGNRMTHLSPSKKLPSSSVILLVMIIFFLSGAFARQEDSDGRTEPTGLTFSGFEYLEYNGQNGMVVTNHSEKIRIEFKTKVANGLLYFSGDGEADDYLKIAVKNGRISIVMKMGSNLVEREVKSSKFRFDDNVWHKIHVHRGVREITKTTGFCHFVMEVDDVFTERGSITGSFKTMMSRVILIGGSDQSISLAGSQFQGNFLGCMKKVEFVADEQVHLDFLSMARDETVTSASSANVFSFPAILAPFQVHGSLIDGCYEKDSQNDSITFSTPESFLALPTWDSVINGRISFKIRTRESMGVIIYSSGAKNKDDDSIDFFGIELFDGCVFLVMNLGSGAVRLKGAKRRVDDGQWHTLSVERSGKTGRVTVDDSGVDFITPGTSAQLDLEGPLFLGAIGHVTEHRHTLTSSHKSGNSVPPELWAGTLGHGFVGCLRDLTMNNDEKIDVGSFISPDFVGINSGCHSSPLLCEDGSCLNGGSCSSGWNRIYCNCQTTAFTGPACERESTSVTFNGDQFMRLSLPEDSKTQAEDIFLRFKTSRPSGLILATSSRSQNMNHLIIMLESGKIKVIINMGEGNKVATIGDALHDDYWHSLIILRRGSFAEVKLDGEAGSAQITGMLTTLVVDSFYLGSFGKIHISSTSSSLYHSTKEVPNFAGVIQQLIFNGKHLIEMARLNLLASFDSTAQMSSPATSTLTSNVFQFKVVPNLVKAVTFKSSESFVALPPLKVSPQVMIYFQFKSSFANGIIMYHGSFEENDYFMVELERGLLHYTFSLNSKYDSKGRHVTTPTTNLHRLTSRSSSFLNDDKWHSVAISKSFLTNHHVLLVDDHLSSTSSPIMISSTTSSPSTSTATRDSHYHDLRKRLVYLGGISPHLRDVLPRQISSKQGFQGCLASIDMNGQLVDPVGSDFVVSSSLVEPGCVFALPATCSFCVSKGICIKTNGRNSHEHNFISNSVFCDCKTSSFAGASCEQQEGSSFKFSGGIILYQFPEEKKLETKSDDLILGIKTESKHDSVVLRVDSSASYDYIEVQIVDGHFIVIYNLGAEDHFIEELNVKVNDNQYHVLKFNRNGPNSTLQIDNHNMLYKTPSGKQLTIFNAQSQIQVGGRKSISKNGLHIQDGSNSGSSILEKTFEGIIFMLSFNDEKVMDLAAEGDPRIKLEGRVELVVSISGLSSLAKGNSFGSKNRKNKTRTLKNKQSQEAEFSRLSPKGDELIVSGSGSCWSHEDCSSLLPSPGTDDLITLSVTSTSFGSTTSSSISRSPDSSHVDCDDEEFDCLDGSGDFDPWEVSSTSSTKQPFDPWPQVTSTWPAPKVVTLRSTSTTEDHSQLLYTSKPIPPDQTITDNPFEQKYRPRTLPPRPSTKPSIIDVPKPFKPSGRDTKIFASPSPTTVRSAAADRTALLIGLIAVLIIVVVVIAPLLLFVRIRYQNSLMANPGNLIPVDSKSNYHLVSVPGGQGVPAMIGPNGTLLGAHHMPLMVPNHVNLSNTDPLRSVSIGACGPPILKRKKNEWYV